MSVLKYNNNGTWEGLNIDHASTADSCLYDANGNVITSTYATKSELPTKVSQLQNDSNFITSAGAPVQSVNGQTGTVSLTIPTNTNQLTNGAGFITSSALTSYLPLSAGSGKKLTGDLYCNGDVHRTPKTYSDSITSTKNLTSTNQKILTISNIEAGRYMITAAYHISITATSSTHVFTNFYKATTATNSVLFSGHSLNRNSSYINDCTWATFGEGGVLSLFIEPNIAATMDTCTLTMIRLG